MPTNTNENTNTENTNTETTMPTTTEDMTVQFKPAKIERSTFVTGSRFVTNTGWVTGPLVMVSDEHISDSLHGMYYLLNTNGVFEREGHYLERLYSEPEPLAVGENLLRGGIYVHRNGTLTEPMRYDEHGNTFRGGVVTLTAEGVPAHVDDPEYDIVSVAMRPLLREGWYGRRRDGGLTGKLELTGESIYMFSDSGAGRTYMPSGHYHSGREGSSDIVELVAPWSEFKMEYPVIDQSEHLLPIRIGDRVMRVDDQKFYVTESSVNYSRAHGFTDHFHMAGSHYCLLTGIPVFNPEEHSSPPAPIKCILSRVSGFNLDEYQLVKFHNSDTSLSGSWLHMGTKVTAPFIAPWCYLNSSGSLGSVKTDYDMQGRVGDYFMLLPDIVTDSTSSIEERRHAASNKALVTYWSSRAAMSAESKNHPEHGRPMRDVIHSIEDLFVREFPALGFVKDMPIVHATYEDDSLARYLYRDGDYLKQGTTTWAKLFTMLMKERGRDVTDEDRRVFLVKVDAAIKDHGFTVEWSTVGDTYCEPMHGWSDRHDSVTGSCMEKFCNDDYGAGHSVFDVYFKLESRGHLKMIKIRSKGKYIGRAICWKPILDNNGWTMDRVYCVTERGEIPKNVVAALAEFANEEGIFTRTDKCCVKSLPYTHLGDISCSRLDDYDNYPYFDTYEGVSDWGVHMDSSSCTKQCKDPDGGYDDVDYECAYGRDGRYPMDELRWSERYDEHVHHEDVVETYNDEVIHTDDSVELGNGSGVYAHEDDVVSVRIPDSRGRMISVYAIPE
jgi:hypothetical protein